MYYILILLYNYLYINPNSLMHTCTHNFQLTNNRMKITEKYDYFITLD
jgi:hypothetical protein